LTKVIEPANTPGGNPVETEMFHYHSACGDNANWTGLPREVIDPNGVSTSFQYDNYGQPATEIENALAATPDAAWPTVETSIAFDAAGFPISSSHTVAGAYSCGCTSPLTGYFSTDGNGRVMGVLCAQIECCLIHNPSGTNGPGRPLTGQLNGTPLYNNIGQPLSVSSYVQDGSNLAFGGEVSLRNNTYEYDELDRLIFQETETTEPTWNGGSTPPTVVRSFEYNFNDVTGTTVATGPDGRTVTTTVDNAGRLASVTRTTPFGNPITATYGYDAADRVTSITYNNGMLTVRVYDDANRLDHVTHKRADGTIVLFRDYTFSPDGLLASVTETDHASSPGSIAEATVIYGYDARNRLTSEVRADLGAPGVPAINYHYTYTYDAGGNRLTKYDVLDDLLTSYVYDITEADDDNQHNNRLLEYMVTQGAAILERGWYTYGPDGNVARFIKLPSGASQADFWSFYYDTRGRLWMAIQGQGQFSPTGDPDTDPENNCVELASGGVLQNCTFTSAAEYRYDSGRQRYLVRPRDPNTLQVWPGAENGAVWHDYLGEDAYADFTVDPANGAATQSTLHLPGIGYSEPGASGWSGGTAANMPAYMHADQIGTRRRVTGTDAGQPNNPPVLGRSVFTAFGETTSAVGANPRHGYVGAFGYQQGLCREVDTNGSAPGGVITWCDPVTALGWLHLGARYYDPSSGRFVMRDPIGIRGGFNVYVYAINHPNLLIDPDGLDAGVGNLDECINRWFATGGIRPNMGWGDFAGYLERNRWDWGGGCPGAVVTGANLGNAGASTLPGRLRAGISTPPHWTSWQHRVWGNAFGRALGRLCLAPLVWEGFWDLGVIIRYPIDPWG
jgi:RHS repeat-associated protein